MKSADVDALADLFPGRVGVEAHTLTAVTSDRGRIAHHRPRALVRVTSVGDVADLVRFCAAHPARRARHAAHPN